MICIEGKHIFLTASNLSLIIAFGLLRIAQQIMFLGRTVHRCRSNQACMFLFFVFVCFITLRLTFTMPFVIPLKHLHLSKTLIGYTQNTYNIDVDTYYSINFRSITANLCAVTLRKHAHAIYRDFFFSCKN